MKKTLVFFLAFTFVVIGILSQSTVQKYPQKMKKTHLYITYPTQNYIYFLPGDVKIKVKLIRPADVLFHVHDLSRGGMKSKLIKAKTLRKARDGSYRGAVQFTLKAGKYHVIAAPQTNLGKDSVAAGPVKFSVRLKLKPIPLKKKN